MRSSFYKFILSSTFLCLGISAYAATPMDLHNQSFSMLQSLLKKESSLKQISSTTDFNKINHIRFKQIYLGYSVWGGDAIAHIPYNGDVKKLSSNKSTMDGVIYHNLTADLKDTPSYVFGEPQAEKAFNQAASIYEKKSGAMQITQRIKPELMVYIDNDNKAHWAYQISFTVDTLTSIPVKPVYIIDAISFQVYETWNNLHTLDDASGGGFGGNIKSGKRIYDGLGNDYPSLSMQRDSKNSICFLQNKDVIVKDFRKNSQIKFVCPEASQSHNSIYWDADQDTVNGAYSPGNDALYIGIVVKEMYQKWYGIPVLMSGEKPMVLNMFVHKNMENAYWDSKEMIFGDGGRDFYPLVSLGIGAHEISHGFTEQHSNLVYNRQSGGLNESFSDMAAQAAEFYSTGKNNWQIGPEIMKVNGLALRYMDEPTKDCHGSLPGENCSINHIKDYSPNIDVHYSSGIFNKAFYLLSTSPGWDTKKAFDVMVQANSHYWTPTSDFKKAACGVIYAAKDYGYKSEMVKKAMAKVGIDTASC